MSHHGRPHERAWLDVPYGEKDQAKACGARWDPEARRWYAPRPGIPALARWAALPPVPDPLPGEDRTFGSGLVVDLVPSTCWFTNVRTCVVPRDWERLRRMIVNRAGRRCEACGHSDDRSGGRWLEAHERWHYENQTSTQILRRLVCLCTGCHGTTHFGLASLRGEAEQALGHLRAVTGMTRREAEDHVDAAYEIWTQRSRTQWTLDLGLLTGAGITLATPMTAADRERAVQDTLRRVGPPT